MWYIECDQMYGEPIIGGGKHTEGEGPGAAEEVADVPESMLENARWERFCQLYACDGNASAAYKKAGYKVKDDETAGSAARRLLQNVAVRNRIAELTAEAKEQALQSSIADIVEIRQRITQIMRGQAEVETKAADMIKAADLLTKIGGQQEPQRVQVQLTLEDKQARLQELLDANR